MKCNTCGKMNCMEHGGQVKYGNPKLAEKGLGMLKKKAEMSPEAKEKNEKSWADAETKLKNLPPPRKMAKGGELEIEIEPKEMDHEDHDDMDAELNDMVADEFFDAVEKKDKKGLLDSIRALVMQCGEK